MTKDEFVLRYYLKTLGNEDAALSIEYDDNDLIPYDPILHKDRTLYHKKDNVVSTYRVDDTWSKESYVLKPYWYEKKFAKFVGDVYDVLIEATGDYHT